MLRHDAKRAWRSGPRQAFEEVTAQLDGEGHARRRRGGLHGPLLTAVDARGVPLLPGLLYGDREGRPEQGAESRAAPGTMPDAEGFLALGGREAPDARGYWPCQAVATYALSGVPAIDPGSPRRWGCCTRTRPLERRPPRRLWASPRPDADGRSRWARRPARCRTATSSSRAGTIDAFCDQIVSGAIHPGDVLVIFGATLIVLGRVR